MSQAERISRIHFLLRNKGKVTLAELKGEFEVSRATVMRDIELMRDRLFAPITYDAQDNAYRYATDQSDSDFWPGGLIEVPGMWIAPNEAYALLTVMNVMGMVGTGALMPSYDLLRSVLKRILTDEFFEMKGYHKKLAVELPNLVLGDRDVMEAMAKALVGEFQATLAWRDANGAEHKSNASLQRFVLGVNGWELQFLTEPPATLHRIPMQQVSACTLTDTRATLLPEFKSDPEADLVALKGVDRGDGVQ